MAPRRLPPEYKRYLENCFKKISNDPYIKHANPEIHDSSDSIFINLKKSSPDHWSIDVLPPWKIPIVDDRNVGKRLAFILMGGILEVKNTEITRYTFSVSIATKSSATGSTEEQDQTAEPYSCCEKVNKESDFNRALRRFHFDIDTGETEDNEVKKGIPVCHVQYGGDAKELRHSGIHYCYDPWLKKPRLPFPPFDMILLFDLLLRQFQTEFGSKFVDDPYWRYLIKNQEELLLSNYYRRINQHFQTESKQILYEVLCDSSLDWI